MISCKRNTVFLLVLVASQPTAEYTSREVTLLIQQPQIAETYYSTCAAIDRHNRYRQDDLRIEKRIETRDWSVRVNLSFFAMIVVDTWLVYNAFKNTPHETECLQKDFYSVLAEEWIDNCNNNRGRAT
jgi:hypothetical protein